MSTITLPEVIHEKLEKAAARRGMDTNTYAAVLVEASLDAEQDDFEDACRGIAAGIADMEAGRTIALEDFIAERRAKRQSSST